MASCPLLNLLPPELRLNIYKHVLASPEQSLEQRESWRPKKESRTPIFQTCRQIYHEAYPVLLSTNTWFIRPTREDHTWLFGLGQHGQTSLRKISLWTGIGHYEFNFEMFSYLPTCRKLELTIHSRLPDLASLYARGPMKYMHGFAEATVGDSGKRYHAHDCPQEVSTKSASLKELLHQLTSACPEDCEMHVGRRASHSQSTIHMDFGGSFLECRKRSDD